MENNTNISDRLDRARAYRTAAKEYFVNPFMGHLLECCKQSEEYKNNPMDEQHSKDWAHSLGVYFYNKYISNNLNHCTTIHQFINTLLLDSQYAEGDLGFDEDFDWIGHCYKAAQIHEHSKDFALLDRKYLFDNQNIYEIAAKFYEDVLDNNPKRIVKILTNK